MAREGGLSGASLLGSGNDDVQAPALQGFGPIEAYQPFRAREVGRRNLPTIRGISRQWAVFPAPLRGYAPGRDKWGREMKRAAFLAAALLAALCLGPAAGQKGELTLKGAIDIHVHQGPDSNGPRDIDADDLARPAKQMRERGLVYKNHWESTAAMALPCLAFTDDAAHAA